MSEAPRIPGGRPSAITPEVLEHARALRAGGKTVRQVASELGVKRSTIARAVKTGIGTTQAERDRARERNSRWSPEAFAEAWQKQSGKCAICGVAMADGGCTRQSVAADHDRLVNRPRALLCNCCNTAIGHFADDPARCQAAALYLVWHSPHTWATATDGVVRDGNRVLVRRDVLEKSLRSLDGTGSRQRTP